ncbi:MAG: histidine phosphatase family protein [Gordonia paraffinivorans]
MGVVYLVRHGQAHAQAYGSLADAQSSAGGLTDVGNEQARRAGRALATRIGRVDHAVAGSLARQQQTLRHVLDAFSDAPDPATDARWDEYDLGAIATGGESGENVHGAGFQAKLDDDLRSWVAGASVGSESYRDYRARADAAARDLATEAGSGRTVVAVSSAGTIAAVIATLWGLDDERWLTVARTMINTSVTKLIAGRTGMSIVSVNDHAHVDLVTDRDVMTFR